MQSINSPMAKVIFGTLLLLVTFIFFPESCLAQTPDNQQVENSQHAAQIEKEIDRTLKNALNAATPGPAKVKLLDQATLNLPADYLFIPPKEAADFMQAMGNSTGPNFVGLVLPKDNHLSWVIWIEFKDSGYIKDDDAKNWNTDELLNNLKEGTEEANKERISNGFAPIKIVGWIETPTYNASAHQLVWSMLAKTDTNLVVNYNTYALGREGYFELDLLTSKSSIDHDKIYAKKILTAVNYNEGKRYEDFAVKTDRVAEYGLAALITGIAAKKLGLLAMLGVFLIKIWKLIVVLPALFWNKIKNFFSGSSKK